jgi:hypothetical protein
LTLASEAFLSFPSRLMVLQDMDSSGKVSRMLSTKLPSPFDGRVLNNQKII